MSQIHFRLLERHQKVDALLDRARRQRWADPFEIARLKKLKLALKDRIFAAANRRAAKTAV